MKRSFKRLATAAALSASACVGHHASAGTLELDFATNNFSELFPAGYDSMRVTLNDGTLRVQQTVLAGMFSGSVIESGTTIDSSELYRDPENVLAYCVDLMQLLSSNAIYEVESVTASTTDISPAGVKRDFGRMVRFLGALNVELQNSHSLQFGDKNWLNPVGGGWMSGAIQLGIWESLYEEADSHLDVFDGWFQVHESGGTSKKAEQAGLDLLEDVFTAVNNPDNVFDFDASTLLWARNDSGQGLVLDPSKVPIPSSFVLLLGGAAGMVLRKRRRREAGARAA